MNYTRSRLNRQKSSLFGLKKTTWRDISGILLAMSLIAYVGHQGKLHEQPHIISPLATNAYAMEDMVPLPSIVEMAPLSEQENNIRIIKKIWGKDWHTGVEIAKCESGLNSQNDNKTLNKDGTYDIGLFMINSIHGWTEKEMKNAVANAGVAYSKFVTQGLDPWQSSKHCWEGKI